LRPSVSEYGEGYNLLKRSQSAMRGGFLWMTDACRPAKVGEGVRIIGCRPFR
jgi:hypothetical protein